MSNQYAFYYNNAACTGCKTCEMACKDYNDLDVEYAYRKIFDMEGGTCVLEANGTARSDVFIYHVTLACNHCDNPACIAVCPTTAMHKDGETGLVSVDGSKCIGCGYCAMACPYGAPTVDREKGRSVKCDGCMSRVKAGQKPICVESCPLRALDFGTVEEMSAKAPRADIAPLPEPSLTAPNLYVLNSACARPSGSHDAAITNMEEVR